MIVRAKLYVSDVVNSGNIYGAIASSTVHFNTVYTPDQDKWENYSFSKATPSGNMKLKFEFNPNETESAHDFKPGQFYYLDCERTPDGDWDVVNKLPYSDNIELWMGHRAPQDSKELLKWGHVYMNITNDKVWPFYDPTEADPKPRYRLTLTPAVK